MQKRAKDEFNEKMIFIHEMDVKFSKCETVKQLTDLIGSYHGSDHCLQLILKYFSDRAFQRITNPGESKEPTMPPDLMGDYTGKDRSQISGSAYRAWKNIMGFLDGDQVDELRAMSKVISLGARDSGNGSVYVKVARKGTDTSNLPRGVHATLEKALEIYKKFHQKYPSRRFEIRIPDKQIYSTGKFIASSSRHDTIGGGDFRGLNIDTRMFRLSTNFVDVHGRNKRLNFLADSTGKIHDMSRTNLCIITPEIEAIFDGLLSVRVKEGTTQIKDNAFANVDLDEVSLPSTLVSIGSMAFSNCMFLERLDLSHTGVETIESLAFNHTGLRYVKFNSRIKRIGFLAFNPTEMLDAVIPEDTLQEWAFPLFCKITRVPNGVSIAQITDRIWAGLTPTPSVNTQVTEEERGLAERTPLTEDSDFLLRF